MKEQDKMPDDRRGFVMALGGAIATAFAAIGSMLLPGSAAASLTDDEDEHDSEEAVVEVQYGMVIDVRRCIGCHACTVACKSEFDVPPGVNRSWVEYTEKGQYPNVGRSFLPRLCNHCSEPLCVDVCPTNATYRRDQDGIIAVDHGVCIACKYCMHACPYDARFLDPVNEWVDKCDFCIHRVSKGLAPSCVNTCVGGARIFGNLADPDSAVSKLIARHRVSVLRSEMGTFPNVYYIDADFTDEVDRRRPELREVRVITHRRHKERT